MYTSLYYDNGKQLNSIVIWLASMIQYDTMIIKISVNGQRKIIQFIMEPQIIWICNIIYAYILTKVRAK